LNQHETSAAARVVLAILQGRVLLAEDVTARRHLSCGPYRTATGPECFAVLGVRDRIAGTPNADQIFLTAIKAARYFVERVGSTRARDSARQLPTARCAGPTGE
jgi:hypothetical protein